MGRRFSGILHGRAKKRENLFFLFLFPAKYAIIFNWMLHHDRLQGTLGLTSIGRDGESTDVVTGTEKPGIFVREGTLIATARICCGWAM